MPVDRLLGKEASTCLAASAAASAVCPARLPQAHWAWVVTWLSQER